MNLSWPAVRIVAVPHGAHIDSAFKEVVVGRLGQLTNV